MRTDLFQFYFYPRRIRSLFVEGLAITQTATQELRPLRDGDLRHQGLRQKLPQLRMMPAQFMSGTVAVFADTCPELFNLGDQLLPGHAFKVFIHKDPFLIV